MERQRPLTQILHAVYSFCRETDGSSTAADYRNGIYSIDGLCEVLGARPEREEPPYYSITGRALRVEGSFLLRIQPSRALNEATCFRCRVRAYKEMIISGPDKMRKAPTSSTQRDPCTGNAFAKIREIFLSWERRIDAGNERQTATETPPIAAAAAATGDRKGDNCSLGLRNETRDYSILPA